MKRFLLIALATLAIVALVAASKLVFATIPFGGELRIAETTWAGGGRLWLAAALIAIAALHRACDPRSRLPILLIGLCLGLLADVAFSGWQWRAEKLAMLEDIGASSIANGIRWGPGVVSLAAAQAFVLAFCLVDFYLATPTTNTERLPT